MICHKNGPWFDECERQCLCYNGELLFCHRIRKDFTAMTLEERRRFTNVLKTAATNPIYKDEYRRICNVHARMPTKLLHHMPQIFLPRHRWYLLEFENILRHVDCRVTVPLGTGVRTKNTGPEKRRQTMFGIQVLTVWGVTVLCLMIVSETGLLRKMLSLYLKILDKAVYKDVLTFHVSFQAKT